MMNFSPSLQVRAAAELERRRRARIQQEVDEAIARIPAYGTRAGYDAWREKLGFTDEQAARYERAGVVLQPKQMQFAVWARRCDDNDGPEEIGLGGARGPGKSFAAFAQTAVDDLQRYPGLKALYLRFTARAATEQLEDLALVVLRHVPGARVKQGRIDFDNGSRIIIGGFKDDQQALSYLGIEYDIIIVEEATQLSARTHAKIRTSNRSSKRFDNRPFRPRRYYTTNPLGVGHMAFKQRFVDNERKRERGEAFDPRIKFIFATVDDNAFVNPEYAGLLDELVGAEYRAYRLGDWDVSAGAYFETWEYNRHVIPPLRDLSYMREVWASMDFGYNHPNVVLLLAMDGDGTIYVVDELVHRKAHPQQIAPDIRAWLGHYDLTVDALSCFLVGTDAFARTGRSAFTVAQQYEAEGITLTRAYTVPGSRVAGAMYLSQLLGDATRDMEPGLYISSRCARLIETLPYLERDTANAEDVRKSDADEQGKGGDDCYDTLRYGICRPHITRMN